MCGRNDGEETVPIINHKEIHENFRSSRAGYGNQQETSTKQPFKGPFKLILICSGIWKPTGCFLIISITMALFCCYQLGYDLYVVIKCPGYDCGFLENRTESHKLKANASSHKSYRTVANTVYTIASIAGFLSYTLVIACLLVMSRQGNASLEPSEAVNDLSKCHLRVICASFVFTTFLFLSSVGLFYYIIAVSQPRDWFFVFLATGVGSQFIAQWLAVVACHVFAVSAFALGTFAKDTLERIRNMDPANLDTAIEIHEQLCDIVTDTVTAFCPWFVAHWLLYGVTCSLAIVYFSEEVASKGPVLSGIYVGFFIVTHMYLFLFPCFCAAYITSSCGGLHAKVNKTTSNAWPSEQHPFKDRRQLVLFTTYAKDRQCVFKIGRITFTTTLAWFSLFLGMTGLFFHFF